MPTSGRRNRSGVQASGRNSGSIVFAMNRTVMNGTPRTNSMNRTLASRTTGNSERRPSASRTPSGSEKTMPTSAVSSETKMPPQSSVSTTGRPNVGEPRNRMKATTG